MKPLNWNKLVAEYWYNDDSPLHKTRKKKHKHTDRQRAKKEIELQLLLPYDSDEYVIVDYGSMTKEQIKKKFGLDL